MGRSGTAFTWVRAARAAAAGLFFLAVLAGRYPNWPRTMAYSLFREAAKKEILWQTRDWERVADDHFEIIYRDPDRDVAPLVLEVAKGSYAGVARMLGHFPPGRVPVIIYPDRASLGRSFGWAADESAMGVYWAGAVRVLSPQDWVQAADQHELYETFRQSGPVVHELAHLAVDYRARGNYPRWLTEGIAQYVERELTGFVMDAPGSRMGRWYPLEKMDRGFDALPDQGLAYRQSLALVDFLVDAHGYEVIDRMLTSLGQGLTWSQALQQETGLRAEELMARFTVWAEEKDRWSQAG
ncbi:MAG: hypothetical protein D9V47_00535 [Clostridia bacterium]|nr:MAG: hypothetical protein D9V47_00535 [Clostridia bacterium]